MSWIGSMLKAGIESNGRDVTVSSGFLQINGRTISPGATAVTVLIKDSAGMVLLATGATVPGDEAGYAKGCLLIDTDVVDGTSGLYVNVGTTTSADFDLVTDA